MYETEITKQDGTIKRIFAGSKEDLAAGVKQAKLDDTPVKAEKPTTSKRDAKGHFVKSV